MKLARAIVERAFWAVWLGLVLGGLSVLVPAALAQLGPDGFGTVQVFGSAPAFSFSAPVAGDYATLTAATGQTITCTRASTATYVDNAGTRVTAASNRCVVESVLSAGPGAAGTAMLRSEGPATNSLLNSSAPATQTTASLATGTYTGWVEGSGSLAFTVGTATATGLPCTATTGATHDCHFAVTVAGTVVATVTGSLTLEQLENSLKRSSYISTAGTAVTRAADQNTTPKPANLTLSGASWSASMTAQLEYVLASGTQQIGLGTNSNFDLNLQLVQASGVSACSDTACTRSSIAYGGNQTLPTKYAMTKVGTTITVYAAGTAGTPATTATQPAEPTTIDIGWVAFGNFGLNGWISSICLAQSPTGCPP